MRSEEHGFAFGNGVFDLVMGLSSTVSRFTTGNNVKEGGNSDLNATYCDETLAVWLPSGEEQWC